MGGEDGGERGAHVAALTARRLVEVGVGELAELVALVHLGSLAAKFVQPLVDSLSCVLAGLGNLGRPAPPYIPVPPCMPVSPASAGPYSSSPHLRVRIRGSLA